MTDAPTAPKDATEQTRRLNEAFRSNTSMDWDDPSDWRDARRGLVAAVDGLSVAGPHGTPAWDLGPYGFLAQEEAPPTVNPSLWRQARLNMEAGLFTVAEGIHQLRGFDLSEITLVEGEEGLIVIDPLISVETAAAAMAFAREHLGDRPVTAVIYTHSHIDHFGGVKGVTTAEDVAAGRCRVIAPEGMVAAAVSENVFAGTAMSRRAQFMYGAMLARGPRGQVDAGLGKTNSLGTVSLILPTDTIVETGQTLVVDGVEIEFQLTPGTEAPAEMNFWFPHARALCMAENCSHNLHNLYTPRGAQVRDALAWARYLDEAIVRFEGRVDLIFTSHHWPVWGAEESMAYLGIQRDLYKYLHDQTLRHANAGLTMAEVAERVELPDSLARHWCNRPYYGTVNHNVKAVYQRYLGWFSGNPAELHPLPPEPAASRYVDYMGGAAAVLARARVDFEAGEYRWVAEVLNRVVFADPDGADPATDAAKELLADTLEQLGYQAESAVWRNFYLVGAHELRNGHPQGFGGAETSAIDLVMSMEVSLLLDAFALRLRAEDCEGERLVLNLELTDLGERHAVWVENSVLHHRRDTALADADASVRLTKAELLMAAAGLGMSPSIQVDGDSGALERLAGWMDRFDSSFPVVTP
jgi:alkyl sulfatase BDS1-like metallo-beta-lactamase superfamily hydrolase